MDNPVLPAKGAGPAPPGWTGPASPPEVGASVGDPDDSPSRSRRGKHTYAPWETTVRSTRERLAVPRAAGRSTSRCRYVTRATALACFAIPPHAPPSRDTWLEMSPKLELA